MVLTRPTGTRAPDNKVLFSVSYTDGRTAYIRVDKEAAIHHLVVARLALEQQASGEMPTGTIAAVKRVR